MKVISTSCSINIFKSFPPGKPPSTCRRANSDPTCSAGHLHCVFDDFWVDSSHTVNSMRANDAQMSHVDLLHPSFFDQRHAPQTVIIAGVQRGDPLQWGREESLVEEMKRSGEQDDKNQLTDNLQHHLHVNHKYSITFWSRMLFLEN